MPLAGNALPWIGQLMEEGQTQEEWKGIGYSPKADTQATWEAFRAASNDFFDRKQVYFIVLQII